MFFQRKKATALDGRKQLDNTGTIDVKAGYHSYRCALTDADEVAEFIYSVVQLHADGVRPGSKFEIGITIHSVNSSEYNSTDHLLWSGACPSNCQLTNIGPMVKYDKADVGFIKFTYLRLPAST